APDLVADDAEREQQPGEDERVGVDRPFEMTLARAEAAVRLGDGLQRHVEDRVVDDDGEQPDDQHAENHPAATVNGLRVQCVPFRITVKSVRGTGKVLAWFCVATVRSFRVPLLSIRNGLVSESISRTAL